MLIVLFRRNLANFCNLNTEKKIVNKMNLVYFRYILGQPHLSINFRYKNEMLKVDREFNFNRNINEKVNTCLDRIKTNIEKEINKKMKKYKKSKAKEKIQETSVDFSSITVQLFAKENNLSEITLEDVLNTFCKNCNELTLKIDDNYLTVAYNTPLVSNLSLPTCILANFVIYPYKLEVQFATIKESIYNWYRESPVKASNEEKIVWEKVSEDILYEPSDLDIGYRLKLECIPSDGKAYGPSVSYISKSAVISGPDFTPINKRLELTKYNCSDDTFRVTSYNILADLYADSDFTRTELFPYCPPHALHIDYRKQLLVKELLGYKSDIICLQEVDSKIYNLDMQIVFESKDYAGNFQKKGSSAEGIATFFNKKKFELIQTYGINIGENISKLDIFKELYKKLQYNSKLLERISERGTALQITVLRSNESQKILMIANTHLYFHPDADHIRLLQAGFSLIYINHIYEKLLKEKDLNKDMISIIFCGDFNSVPECGIYKLLTENSVDQDFIDWKSNKEEAVEGVILTQPFKFQSACGIPDFTNYTASFSACLDYIFYQTDNLEVKTVVPFPTKEEVSMHVALPSPIFPSDHIALVTDLGWKRS